MHTFTVSGHQLNFQTAKHEAEAVRDYIEGKLVRLRDWKRELGGELNGRQYESEVMVIGGSNGLPLTDPDGYDQKMAEFFDWFPDPYVPADQPELLRRGREIRAAHMPIQDDRLTDEQVKQRQEKIDAQEREHKERQEKICQQLGVGPEEIKTPDGMMAVYLQCTYNDSDVIAEHYHPDAGYGPPQLLAHVRKGARTEKLARQVIAKYPELARLNWQWKKSDGRYSTPHLIGPSMGICEHLRGRTDKPNFIYRVYIDCFRENLPTYKNYGAGKSEKQNTGNTESPEEFYFAGITIAVKPDRDWTWIEFSAKPAEEIAGKISGLGFRRSEKRQGEQWFAKKTVKAEEIKSALGAEDPPPALKLTVTFIDKERMESSFGPYKFVLESAEDFSQFAAYMPENEPADPEFQMMEILDGLGFTAVDTLWLADGKINPFDFILAVKTAYNS